MDPKRDWLHIETRMAFGIVVIVTVVYGIARWLTN
jgi:hypothetical protein